MSLVLLPAAWLVACGFIRATGDPQDLRSQAFPLLLCGLALVAILMLGVGSFSLRLALFIAVALGAAGVGLCIWLEWAQPPAPEWRMRPGEPRLPIAVAAALGAALGLSILVGYIASLAPVTGWDAAVAHIALPANYARAGRIYLDDGNVYSGYPHLLHTLYAVAYAGGGERSVTLLNWVFAVFACVAVYSLARRLAGKHAGLAAAAILATAPIFADQIGSVSIDLAFAAFSTTALWLCIRWLYPRDALPLVLAGFLAGSSCGIRHTGYIVCLLLLVGVVLSARGARLPAALLFAGPAFLGLAPWALRTWWVVGNPIFPFLLQWFPPSPVAHMDITGMGAHETAHLLGWQTLFQFLRFPWDIIMRPQDFDGWAKSPGALVLVLGVPALVFAGRAGLGIGGFSAAGGAALFFFQRFARYLLPFFTPMMSLAGVAAVRAPRWKPLVWAVLLTHVFYGLALHAAAMHFKVPVAFGVQSREDYLKQRLDRMGMFAYANQKLNDGSTVLTLDQRSYYLDMPAFQNHWQLNNLLGMTEQERYDWMRWRHIRYILYPSKFVEESGNIRAQAQALLGEWLSDSEHYALHARLELPAARGEEPEQVLVFRLRDPDEAAEAAP